MKTLIYLMILMTILAGCSSTSEHSYVGDLKNEDFVPPKIVPFNERSDYYQLLTSKNYSLLIEESLDRLDSGERSEIEKSTDEIGKITLACYNKNFNEAFELSDKAFRRYKEHAGYWNAIGACYLLKNEFRKAQLYFNKALDTKKDYAPAFNNLGVIYRKRGESQKALVAFERANNLSRFSQTPKFNLAQIYLDHGLIEKSLELLENLIKAAPKDVDVRAALATAYLFNGKYRAAISEYAKLPSSLSEKPEIGLNYAMANYLKGDKDQARDIFELVKNNNKNLENYYLELKKLLR